MQPHRTDSMHSFAMRPEFYRRMYRAVLKVVVVNSFILALLCALTVYLGFYGFKPEHYFTTSHTAPIKELPYTTHPTYREAGTESQKVNEKPAATQ